jgi:hypothetical protein
MRFSALNSSIFGRISAFLVVLVALGGMAANAQQQDDPPDQAARLSWTSGQVSVQPMGTDEWGQAYANLTLGPGDRIYTDADGRAEIQIGQTYLRIGPNTDISFVDASDQGISFGMAQGSVHLRSFGLWQNQQFDLSTPNGNVSFQQTGDMRVDVYPNSSTVFTDYAGAANVTAAGNFNQPMDTMQSLELAGVNPVSPQWLQIGGADDLDQWAQERDRQIIDSASYQYVSQDVPGAADLDTYGSWQPDTDYGPVWYPRSVAVDWQPYHNGHWIYRDPWGWTWVEDEPWGYAPFHYGRWVNLGGRWGWVPGPRQVRPVWSPALVVFAGGANLSAWIPLGPGEPYRPWYRCSPRYIDRVNIANIHGGRRVHVESTYVNIVNVTSVTNIRYVNRDRGMSAMRPDDFARGRQAAMRFDQRQTNNVRIVDRPQQNPTRDSFVTRPVSRPVPVGGTRPVVINRQGMMTGTRPGSTPQQAPVRSFHAVQPPAGRTVTTPPSNSRFRGAQSTQQNHDNAEHRGGQSEPQVQQPAQPQQPAARPVGRPVMGAPGRMEDGKGPTAQPVGKPVMGQPGRANDDSKQQNSAPTARPVGRPVAGPPARMDDSSAQKQQQRDEQVQKMQQRQQNRDDRQTQRDDRKQQKPDQSQKPDKNDRKEHKDEHKVQKESKEQKQNSF